MLLRIQGAGGGTLVANYDTSKRQAKQARRRSALPHRVTFHTKTEDRAKEKHKHARQTLNPMPHVRNLQPLAAPPQNLVAARPQNVTH